MRYHVRRIAKIFLVLSGFSPLALILLIKAIIWDWPMQRLARSAVKNTAAAMGLSYIPSQYIREFGELTGTIDGYLVIIKPEENTEASIQIVVPETKKYNPETQVLELSTQKPRLHPEKNTGNFTTENRYFNRIFKTRRIDNRRASKIKAARLLQDTSVSFYTQGMLRISCLIVASDTIVCKLNYGFYLFPYIPARSLEPLVDGLLSVARARESCLS